MMCWTMTLRKMKRFPQSIDASSRQAVRIHAMADQETRYQFREMRFAEMKSVFDVCKTNWKAHGQELIWRDHPDNITYQLIRLRPTPSRGEQLHEARCCQRSISKTHFSRVESLRAFGFQ